jgi:hypothetical protein
MKIEIKIENRAGDFIINNMKFGEYSAGVCIISGAVVMMIINTKILFPNRVIVSKEFCFGNQASPKHYRHFYKLASLQKQFISFANNFTQT